MTDARRCSTHSRRRSSVCRRSWFIASSGLGVWSPSPLPFWSQRAPITDPTPLYPARVLVRSWSGRAFPRLQSARGREDGLMADPLAASGVTRKEAEVLAGLGEQLSNAEIAARVVVSERTVETHVSSLLRKLGASNRRELGRLAGRTGATSTIDSGRIGPSGTVTFLFTDVENSTALWDRHPALMPDVLMRHDAAVRNAITVHGGHTFTATGDGFGAAFASAPEAVAAAVDAQRALESESWPGDVTIRVRMGVHSGTATERNGNYFGGAVNRAARITVIGRGGQILLSAATADLVADQGWTMVDLGRHRLKGLERPERIVRLDASALPVVTLSLRGGADRPGNLPHPSTTLIGRQDDVSRLVE